MHCLGPRLDVRRFHTEQLAEILSLDEGRLLAALSVRSVEELEARYGSPANAAVAAVPIAAHRDVPLSSICVHDPRYPQRPEDPSFERWAPPAVLRVAGALEPLDALAVQPAAALVGTRRATDYGRTIAHGLARELVAAGLPIVAPLSDGIASAAHDGALAAGGVTVAALAAGVERAHPASRRALYGRIVASGCAISELPFGSRARRWSYAARERIVAGLAAVVVVVEAEERPGDLMLARFARELGRTVVAVPGRVTSPASGGTHSLIREGVPIVRDAADVLDALYRVGRAPAASTPVPEQSARGRLAAGTKRVFELVGRGADTADRLVVHGIPLSAALTALTELELAGELVRGEGGRYLPCGPPTSARRSGL